MRRVSQYLPRNIKQNDVLVDTDIKIIIQMLTWKKYM